MTEEEKMQSILNIDTCVMLVNQFEYSHNHGNEATGDAKKIVDLAKTKILVELEKF